MSPRWSVAFMKGTEQVGETQVVEAEDEVQARFVAHAMFPDLARGTDGTLIMEEHRISPTQAVDALGEVWDAFRKIQAQPNLTAPWAELGEYARGAWVHYIREHLADPLQVITSTVMEINAGSKRLN